MHTPARSALRTAEIHLIPQHAKALLALLVAAPDEIAEAAMARLPTAQGRRAAAARVDAAAAHRADRAVLLVSGEALEVALPLRVADLNAVCRRGDRASATTRRRAAVRRNLGRARAVARLLTRGARSAGPLYSGPTSTRRAAGTSATAVRRRATRGGVVLRRSSGAAGSVRGAAGAATCRSRGRSGLRTAARHRRPAAG